MTRRIRRRELLKGAAAGVGFWITGMPAWADSDSPNEKLDIACIGAGGRGGGNINGVAGENIVALCEVDRHRGKDMLAQHSRAEQFSDYRRMFDKLHKSIDAVVVSTPDHMHAPITLAAMELGKHVYCEKPLVRTVAEALRVAEATRRHPKLATQMGNGGNARSGARRNVELIRSGALGNIREVHAWTDRPAGWWPQPCERPKEGQEIPGTLDWDLWLGVAPKRPFHECYLPFKWRAWWDFGTGAMGDMACHVCNLAFWSLELKDPTVIDCEVSDVHAESAPAWSIIHWQFPANDKRGPVKFHWYDGGKKPSKELVNGMNIPGNGSIFVGDKGTLYAPSPDGSERVLLPEDRFADFDPPDETIPDSPGHHEEWIQACKGNDKVRPYMSHFGRAAVMTESLLLGNLAVRTGKRIEWDAKAMKVTNLPEANAFLDPPYRLDW